MWPPTDIMRGPLTNNLLEMTFVERNQVVKTFATKAPAQSLAHRVGLGGSHRRPQNSHPQVRQTLVDLLRGCRDRGSGSGRDDRPAALPGIAAASIPPWDGQLRCGGESCGIRSL